MWEMSGYFIAGRFVIHECARQLKAFLRTSGLEKWSVKVDAGWPDGYVYYKFSGTRERVDSARRAIRRWAR